jgi:hypothetical protein
MRITRLLALSLQAEGQALHGRCGAKNRRGLPCLGRPATERNGRCRFHGGLSTGPKTPETRAKSIAAMQAGHRRWRAASTKGPILPDQATAPVGTAKPLTEPDLQ